MNIKHIKKHYSKRTLLILIVCNIFIAYVWYTTMNVPQYDFS